MNSVHVSANPDFVPFALLQHEDASIEASKSLGCPDQEWSWKPAGDFKESELSIYASGNSSTSRTTFQGQVDHGEFQ